jgi:Flp pilus assembly protein TadD
MDEAERLAAEAVSLAEETDAPNWQASAVVDLAEVYAAEERLDVARAAFERARSLFAEKGNVVAARQVDERLRTLSADVEPRVKPE